MFSITAAAASGNLAALSILRSASVWDARESQLKQTSIAFLTSVAAEFGTGSGKDPWIPDMTIRSAALGDYGRTYIAGNHSKIVATSGDDFINTGKYNTVYAGAGDDFMHVNSFGVGYGEEGNDGISGEDSTLYGGAGDDWVRAVGGEGFGDEGNDVLEGLLGGSVYGGKGDDIVQAGDGSLASGGEGNDLLVGEGKGNTLIGEWGDDYIDLTRAIDSRVVYLQGDGHDTIDVGSDYSDSNYGPIIKGKNRLELGTGLSSGNTTIEIKGDQAFIRFSGDSRNSITVKFQDDTALTVAFKDGTTRDISRAGEAAGKAISQTVAAYKQF